MTKNGRTAKSLLFGALKPGSSLYPGDRGFLAVGRDKGLRADVRNDCSSPVSCEACSGSTMLD